MSNLKSSAALALLLIIAIFLGVLVYQNRTRPQAVGGEPTRLAAPTGRSAEKAGAAERQTAPPTQQVQAAVQPKPAEPIPAALPVVSEPVGAAEKLVPLMLNLPPPGFPGTPKDIPLSAYMEPLSDKPRPPLMVPAGLTNVAPGSVLTSSDKNMSGEVLAKIVDGDKEGVDQSILFLRKGTQWVQLDLGEPFELFAIVVWHAHDKPKVFHDVIVLASNDAAFTAGVESLYNNDQDNTSALGVGTDKEYFETREGRLINPRGSQARYLRFYTKGSTDSALNEYTEIEVYGRRPQGGSR